MERFRIRNWRDYNRGLVQRGSLDIMVSPKALATWREVRQKKKPGHPVTYSNDAILLLLMLKVVYGLTYRAVEGFTLSLFRLMHVDLPVPNYAHLCRRAQSVVLPSKLSNRRPRAIVIDSTGLKIFGEGEWKVKKHGYQKRRSWKKIHLAVCPETHDVIAGELTQAEVSDDQVLPRIAKKLPRSITEGYLDGAYDTHACHRVLHQRGIRPLIPPRKTAKVYLHPPEHWKTRNDAVKLIQALGNDSVARKIWKKSVRYHRRSLAETAMFRLKQLMGPMLYSRITANQEVELVVKLLIINRFNSLGMPQSYRI